MVIGCSGSLFVFLVRLLAVCVRCVPVCACLHGNDREQWKFAALQNIIFIITGLHHQTEKLLPFYRRDIYVYMRPHFGNGQIFKHVNRIKYIRITIIKSTLYNWNFTHRRGVRVFGNRNPIEVNSTERNSKTNKPKTTYKYPFLYLYMLESSRAKQIELKIHIILSSASIDCAYRFWDIHKTQPFTIQQHNFHN